MPQMVWVAPRTMGFLGERRLSPVAKNSDRLDGRLSPVERRPVRRRRPGKLCLSPLGWTGGLLGAHTLWEVRPPWPRFPRWRVLRVMCRLPMPPWERKPLP